VFCATIESESRYQGIELAQSHTEANQYCVLQPAKYFCNTIKPKADAERTRLVLLSSRAEEFHPRALPKPCVNLSTHTAPDVRPFP
jgi:hypothetical protein